MYTVSCDSTTSDNFMVNVTYERHYTNSLEVKFERILCVTVTDLERKKVYTKFMKSDDPYSLVEPRDMFLLNVAHFLNQMGFKRTAKKFSEYDVCEAGHDLLAH